MTLSGRALRFAALFLLGIGLSGCPKYDAKSAKDLPGDITGPCRREGRRCESSAECCGVSVCIQGRCDAGVCSSAGMRCESSSECCGLAICESGICSTGTGCIGRGGSCNGDGDCCGVLACAGGRCR